MSILIPGMEMPKSCARCRCNRGCQTVNDRIARMDERPWFPSDHRHNDCPLVPVPEHGPLVDALDIINTFPDDYVFTNEQARALTNYIIPADPAEEVET